MIDSEATSVMTAPKKKKSAGGRPAEPEPIRSLISLKGTTAFEKWLDGLVEHSRQGTRTLLLKNALRKWAETEGYKPPQPRR